MAGFTPAFFAKRTIGGIITATITGLTGANTGYSRTIANLGNGSQIGLFKAFLFTIAIGDTFTLLPGCDHTTGTCSASFQNLLRFGGFPYIPPPEVAV